MTHWQTHASPAADAATLEARNEPPQSAARSHARHAGNPTSGEAQRSHLTPAYPARHSHWHPPAEVDVADAAPCSEQYAPSAQLAPSQFGGANPAEHDAHAGPSVPGRHVHWQVADVDAATLVTATARPEQSLADEHARHATVPIGAVPAGSGTNPAAHASHARPAHGGVQAQTQAEPSTAA